MKATDKSITIEKAIAKIKNGDTVMVSGFGVPGTPYSLLEELVKQGQKNLTIIKNDSNMPGMGIDRLLSNNQVKKLIVSHIGLNPNAVKMMNEKKLEVEFCPQGILAERIRCAGAGLHGFLTDIGIKTELANEKQTTKLDGQTLLIEKALHADFALIHADRADRFGNLVFAGTAQNFGPLMAMAASQTLAETDELVAVGQLQPEEIHTAGPFVDAVVFLPELSEYYNVIKR